MPEEITGDGDDKNILEFAQICAICTIPADEKSPDTSNFVKIVIHCINDSDDQIMTVGSNNCTRSGFHKEKIL